jgi:hypothetical protein
MLEQLEGVRFLNRVPSPMFTTFTLPTSARAGLKQQKCGKTYAGRTNWWVIADKERRR